MKTNTEKLFNKRLLLAIIAGFALLLAAFTYYNQGFYAKTSSVNELKQHLSNRFYIDFDRAYDNKNAQPEDVLPLAKRLSDNGYWMRSNVLIENKILSKDVNGELKKQTAELTLNNRLAAYYKNSADDSVNNKDKTESYHAVREQLKVLSDTASFDTLKTLAEQSINFKLYPQAAMLYARMAKNTDQDQALWWNEAGQWAEKASDDLSAERYFKQALLHSYEGSEEHAKYSYAWLKKSIAMGNLDEARTYIETREQADNVSSSELEQLAHISQDLGKPEMTAQLFVQLAVINRFAQKKWFEKAAYRFGIAGLTKESTDYTDRAIALTSEPSEINALNKRLLSTLVKNEQHSEAVTVVKRLREAGQNDPKLLANGVQYALAAEDFKTASEWNKTYLNHQSGADKESVLMQQIDIETLAKRYSTATQFAQQAVDLKPNDKALREKLAYLAEKSGNNKKAIQQWTWLNNKTANKTYKNHIVRLAYQDIKGKGVNTLIALSKKQSLPEQAVMDVFTLLGKRSPQRAETFLQRYLNKYDAKNKRRWQHLADWQVGKKRYAQAIKTWQKIERLSGTTTGSRLMIMQLYWMMNDPLQAKKAIAHKRINWQQASRYQHEIVRELNRQ